MLFYTPFLFIKSNIMPGWHNLKNTNKYRSIYRDTGLCVMFL
jgi:hypothetical protein